MMVIHTDMALHHSYRNATERPYCSPLQCVEMLCVEELRSRVEASEARQDYHEVPKSAEWEQEQDVP